MITFLIILVALGVAVFHFRRTQGTLTKPEDLKVGKLVGSITIFLGIVAIWLIQPYSLKVIQAGNVGIKVSLLGDDRGVGKYEYRSGLVVYNSWTEKVEEIPLTQQHVEYEQQETPSHGGLPVKISPKFNYSVIAGNAGDMYVNLRKPLEQIEKQWLSTAVLQAVTDVTNKWKVDSIFTHKEAFETNITTEANKRVGKWFKLSQLRTNILPPPSLISSIQDKTKAIQDVQVAEQRKLVAIAQGITKRENAKADSAVRVIAAAADARSNNLRQASLTPMLIQQQYIEAWRAGGSQVPQIVSGNGGFMLNLQDFKK